MHCWWGRYPIYTYGLGYRKLIIPFIQNFKISCPIIVAHTLSYASAHVHDSSNHSYVSMNMDSINDCSLLHPDIYRSFFDDGIYESTVPLPDLPISPSTNLAESSPRPQNDPQWTAL